MQPSLAAAFFLRLDVTVRERLGSGLMTDNQLAKSFVSLAFVSAGRRSISQCPVCLNLNSTLEGRSGGSDHVDRSAQHQTWEYRSSGGPQGRS